MEKWMLLGLSALTPTLSAAPGAEAVELPKAT